MLSFKEFVLEINDNTKEDLPKVDPADVRRKYIALHNNKNRDALQQRQYEILKDHPAIKDVHTEGYNAKPAFAQDMSVKRNDAKPAFAQDMSVKKDAKPAVVRDQTVRPKKQKPPALTPMTPVE